MYTLLPADTLNTMGSLDVLELPSRQEQRKNSSSSLRLRGSLELPTIKEHEEATGLDKLKTVTTRLQLSTRRASILEWKENVKQTMLSPTRSTFVNGGNHHGDSSSSDDEEVKSDAERRAHIDSSLEWLRTELVGIK